MNSDDMAPECPIVAAANLARRTRASQGLPERVEDASVLARVAALLRGTLDAKATSS